MKTQNDLRTVLGIKQREMAGLLGITRAHYAMFETGKRKLPQRAAILFQELLLELQKTKATEKAKSQSTARKQLQAGFRRDSLNDLIFENEKEKRRLEKKIATLSKKLESGVSRSHFAASLDKRAETKKPEPHFKILIQPQIDPTKILRTLTQYELKLQYLQMSREWLDLQLKAAV
jgi:transcriptional regulator with XRE-family HTH domain